MAAAAVEDAPCCCCCCCCWEPATPTAAGAEEAEEVDFGSDLDPHPVPSLGTGEKDIIIICE